MGKYRPDHHLRWWYCEACGKKTYEVRKIARKAMKAFHPQERMTTYPCPHQRWGWHFGHPQPGDRDVRERDR